MEFKTYDESILPRMADLVQSCFPLHEISVKTLRRLTLEDPNFLPNDLLVASEDGVLKGAVLAARYRRFPEDKLGDKSGYLKFICASPFDASLLHTLLEKVEERMRDEGSERLLYSNFASWHLVPGVDLRYEDLLDFLLSEGFTRAGQCVDYVIDLSAFRVPRRIACLEKSLIDRGFSFRLASKEEKEEVADWVKNHFGSCWSYEASRAVGQVGAGVWLAEDSEGVVGFSVYGSLEYHWFGPMGVVEEKRKMGLGSVLLFKTLDSMKKLGISRAIIPWTGHLFFYSQVPGIVGIRHYWVMEKKL